MNIQNEKLYTLNETAVLIQISKQTLRNWDNSGTFKAIRTDGKHRRYYGKQITEHLEKMRNGKCQES